MNQDIKDFIKSYAGMVDPYRDKVPADSGELADTIAYLKKMEDLGEKCGDISSFLTKVTEQDMLNEFNKYLTRLAEASLKGRKQSGTVTAKEPSVADAARGYHAAYDAMADKDKKPETCRVYERIFAIEKSSRSAIEFMRKCIEEGLFVKMSTVPLMEISAPLIAAAEAVSLPVMAFHHEKMIEAAKKAKSAMAIDCEAQRLLECNRVELMLDQMIAYDLVYFLGDATSSFLMSPTEENRQWVENSYRFIAEFFGLNADDLFALPRVIDIVEKILVASVNKGQGGKKYTVQSFIQEQKDVVAHCTRGKDIRFGPAAAGSAVIWGKTYPFKDVLKVMRNPIRPEEFLQ